MIKLAKTNLFLVLAIGIISSGYAQDQSTSTDLEPLSNFSYGFRAGGVASTFSKEQPNTGYKMGFMIGGIATYRFSDKFSLQAEPAYLQQGGTFVRFTDNTRFGDTSPFSIYTTHSSVTVHTIDLPILAKYNLPKFGDFQGNVVLGPAIGYTIGADDRYTRTYYLGQSYTTVSGRKYVTGEYEKFQVGATVGFGGEVSLGNNKRLLIDLRYRYGITPVKKGYSYIDLYNVQGDLRTHSIYFALGIGF